MEFTLQVRPKMFDYVTKLYLFHLSHEFLEPFSYHTAQEKFEINALGNNTNVFTR